MKEMINQIVQGDCLNEMRKIATGSVSMILSDLPYGYTQNSWDTPLPLDSLWQQYKRILKPAGVVVLTSMGRFTAQLIESNPTWFKYKIVWIKNRATNFLNAKKQPLRKHEDICVFYRKQPYYKPQTVPGKPYQKYRKHAEQGTYGAVGPGLGMNDGERYPTDVLHFQDDYEPDWVYCPTAKEDGSHHPTQKPVELGRWLIRTYTRPGEIVLDNCCGSGSFMVAAVLEGRKFIGIEKNETIRHKSISKDLISLCRFRVTQAKRAMK